ncbi:sensor histidine kinase [Zafaria sp. J156]|nr:histidine kinase [Zafaria sp. J156]
MRTIDADVPAGTRRSKLALTAAAVVIALTEAVFLGADLAGTPGGGPVQPALLTYLPTLQLVVALLLVWHSMATTVTFSLVALATSLVTGNYILAALVLPFLLLLTLLYLKRNTLLGCVAGMAIWIGSLILFYPQDAPLLVYLLPACAVAGGLGWALRTHRVTELELEAERERERLEAERSTVALKRSMARDLHDILAHNLAVISLQTEAQRFSSSPETTSEILNTVNRVAKQTLSDMRTLLTLLYVEPADAAPADGTGVVRIEVGLEQIALTLTSLGHRPELSVTGLPGERIPPAQSSTFYRLLQEAATNILKHAPDGARCRLSLDVAATSATLVVANELAGPVTVPTGRTGSWHYGLKNMRERVRAFGGTLEAGPGDGWWTVTASLSFVGE